MGDHRAPADFVQHLGLIGFHARALAGGQHHDSQWARGETRRRLVSFRVHRGTWVPQSCRLWKLKKCERLLQSLPQFSLKPLALVIAQPQFQGFLPDAARVIQTSGLPIKIAQAFVRRLAAWR